MKLLIIEDEPSLRLGISRALQRAGHHVSVTDQAREGIALFRAEDYDIVITDLALPDINGIEVLKAVKDLSPDAGVIVITAFANVKTAVEAMRAGAYDYLSKPFDPEELLILIERFSTQRRLKLDNTLLREELRESRQFESIIAGSPAMLAIFETVTLVAKTDSSVIIYGETGTGKELIANALHSLSQRKERPFIKINCAAIPETLLESELFGYEKGAFTGALQRKKGKFELADGGTIFFDEIGDMPPGLQAKLLRVLENLTFERLGGTEQLTVDVRTLFATRKNLEEEIKKGNFREDLFYRLNVVPITLPPLRERKADVLKLVEHFLKMFCAKNGKPDLTLSPEAMEMLCRYDYPGNIRELKHAVEMAVALCNESSIAPGHLPAAIRGTAVSPTDLAAGLQDLPMGERMKTLERRIIEQALEKADGKKIEAAKKLGISRKTLWRKLREHEFPQSVLEDEE